jgi:hypothetical protein
MSDPAVEAAQRAKRAYPNYQHREVASAREALEPIRKLHQRIGGPLTISDNCTSCNCFWPCATAWLVYREEELT